MPARSPYQLRPSLLLLLVVVVAVAAWFKFGRAPSREDQMRELAAQLTALEAREQQVAETLWAKELLAEQCGHVFEQLWDSLNAARDKSAVLAGFRIGELTVPQWGPAQEPGHDIEVRTPSGSGGTWSTDRWRQFLATSQRAGWQLAQTEFRHNRFEVDASGQPRQSIFHFTANLINAELNQRASLNGDLRVDWDSERSTEGEMQVRRIDAGGLTLQSRRGDPPFRRVFLERVDPPPKSFFIDPAILQDLDGDGLSEIVLAAKNLVFRRRPDGSYTSARLCRQDPALICAAVIADFDRDGDLDFLCARFEGLDLFRGSARGTFDEPAQPAWRVKSHLKYGQVLTCGDVDADGDLDVWLGQYKGPYTRGQMPTPYYDANDGYPAYLLLNDGQGRFRDATETAGLGGKRWRRTYSGSLVDLDEDGDLDLLVVSDFAGVDLYVNDGRGRFRDVTTAWLNESRGFGMAHTLGDFNRDGRLDFLVTGMHCPAALRIHHLGLTRPEHPDYTAMIPQMTAGSRLYLSVAPSPGEPTEAGVRFRCGSSMNVPIARSGWSWGCSAFDFDNDGFLDVAVATGHESLQSVRDYEPEFWKHDIYVGTSKDDLVRHAYFGAKNARTRGRGQSYGGYEKNRLYWNRAGTTFLEIGHLMGVALEQDSRNAVTDDLNGDGRLDLVVTTFEAWPEVKQTLQVYQNTTSETGHWISARLRQSPGGPSPVGARVLLRTPGSSRVRYLVTGDSHRAQHDTVAHFGLGSVTNVDSIEVRWPDGQVTTLRRPAVDRCHLVGSPARE